MPKKGITKGKISATIDAEILKRFNSHCEENAINKSQLLEKMIEKFLDDKKKGL